MLPCCTTVRSTCKSRSRRRLPMRLSQCSAPLDITFYSSGYHGFAYSLYIRGEGPSTLILRRTDGQGWHHDDQTHAPSLDGVSRLQPDHALRRGRTILSQQADQADRVASAWGNHRRHRPSRGATSVFAPW